MDLHKDIQQRPKAEPMLNVPLKPEQQSIQSNYVIRADSKTLRADLDRARNEYLLGYYAEAEQAVRKVIGSEPPVSTPLTGEAMEEGQVFLICASAWTLL